MNVNLNPMKAALILLAMITCEPRSIYCADRRLVGMTLVRNASSLGAYCLDGSLPAYHLDRGFGAGRSNWLLQFEGGGWCNDIESCSERAGTRRGSTRYMSKVEVFSGILSNNASLNPEIAKIDVAGGGIVSGQLQSSSILVLKVKIKLEMNSNRISNLTLNWSSSSSLQIST